MLTSTMFSRATAALCALFVAGTALAQQTGALAPTALIESVVGGVVAPGAVTSVQANEGDFLQFTAQDSSDPNVPTSPLQYLWQQISGPTVQSYVYNNSLFDISVPYVGGVGGIMTYQLTVTNGLGLSASSTVNVQIKVANHPPVASIAQPTQPIAEGSLVTLDASATYDPDGDPLTYTWTQTGGPAGFPHVVLDLTNPAKPTFTAPIVGSLASYQFELVVFDGQATAVAIVNLQTYPTHHAPIASAGTNVTAAYGDTVTLDGTGSTDPDGNLLTYIWAQTSGPTVTLNYTNPAKPTFVAPSSESTLTFSLTVSDVYLVSAPATVTVSVFPVSEIPNCGNAHANKTLIWPPNQTFARIKIRGLETEPSSQTSDTSGDDGEGAADADDPNEDGYRNMVRVTSITQDEPTSGTFKGDLSPDAIVQSTRPNGKPRVRDLIMIRREESPTGDGRVYGINFTVTNTLSGLTCTAAVKVCVPTKRKNGQCVDSGQNYNSFSP
jgi:chitinase